MRLNQISKTSEGRHRAGVVVRKTWVLEMRSLGVHGPCGGNWSLGTDITVIRWKKNRHKDTERQKQQANMTDWMWVWRNNKRWCLQGKTGKRDFGVYRNMSSGLHILCSLLLLIWSCTNSDHSWLQNMLASLLYIFWSFHSWCVSAVRAAAAASPCPELFTSNSNIQGMFSHIVPSMEGMQTLRPREAQIAAKFTAREICSLRSQTYLSSVWRI